MIIAHCAVYGEPERLVPDGFCCFVAIDPLRGLYYEFQWEELREKALEVPDFWDCREQWDISAEEAVPKKSRAVQESKSQSGLKRKGKGVARPSSKKARQFAGDDIDEGDPDI